MMQWCFIFVPKRREGSRGTLSNITFSVRTQGVTNGLSYVAYRPELIVRRVFSPAMLARIQGGEVLRIEKGEFERSTTCMGFSACPG